MTIPETRYVRVIGFAEDNPQHFDTPATLAEAAKTVYEQAIAASGNLTVDPEHADHSALHQLACAKTAQFGYEAGTRAALRTVRAQFVAGFARAGMPIAYDTVDEVLARHMACAKDIHRSWRKAATTGNYDSIAFPVGLIADYMALMAGTRQALDLTPSPTMAELTAREHASSGTTRAGNDLRLHLFATTDINALGYTDSEAEQAHQAAGHEDCGLAWDERQIEDVLKGADPDIRASLRAQVAWVSCG